MGLCRGAVWRSCVGSLLYLTLVGRIKHYIRHIATVRNIFEEVKLCMVMSVQKTATT